MEFEYEVDYIQEDIEIPGSKKTTPRYQAYFKSRTSPTAERAERIVTVTAMPRYASRAQIDIARLIPPAGAQIDALRHYATIFQHAADLAESWQAGASFSPAVRIVAVRLAGMQYSVYECHGAMAVIMSYESSDKPETVHLYQWHRETPDYARDLIVRQIVELVPPDERGLKRLNRPEIELPKGVTVERHTTRIQEMSSLPAVDMQYLTDKAIEVLNGDRKP